MQKVIKLKSLPIEIPYNPKVIISYNENYESGFRSGWCQCNNIDKKLHITINTSNKSHLEKNFSHNGKNLEM